jgi:hypothetical protein
MEQQGIKILPPFFIDKTTNIDLKELMPLHWNGYKTCLSAGSYLTEVFEKQTLQSSPNIKP